MPEVQFPKIRPHIALPAGPCVKGPYAELQVTSNFSFLRGGSHPEELVARAAELGCHAVGITDVNTLAGIVRAHTTAQEAGIQLLVGCHLQVGGKGNEGNKKEGNEEADSLISPFPYSIISFPLSLLVYPADRAAYGRLCRLLTYGKRKAAKGQCDLTLQDVIDHQAGLLAVVLPPPLLTDEFAGIVRHLRAAFDDDRLSVAAACLYDGRNEARLAELMVFSRSVDVPLAATNDVHYHMPERQALQDVLTCIRLGCTVREAGFALFANAERHIKGPEEMARLFSSCPQAIRRTLQIAERAGGFSLDQLKYEYPSEVCPAGKTMMQHLIDRTWEGARGRYPEGIPATIRQRLEHEFALIRDLNYPAYFLTVDDIVAFARSQGILCQGRGAAANSAVCYCLGITSVDPARIDLLVERFISKERNEPPDIDIDFEHERREEVIQYIYQKYGRERAALTAEVISYRRRSAVREVGKALGLSLDCVDKLAKSGDWWEDGAANTQRLRELGLDPRDATIRQTVALTGELIGFPRHLSQHVGGFVITQRPLCEMVPVENAAMPNRTVIEWDKDDIDAMGMMKVDVLGLGMLTCIRKAMERVNQWRWRGNDECRMSNDESMLNVKINKCRNDVEGKGSGTLEHSTFEFDSSFDIRHSPFSPLLQFHTIPAEDPAVYDMLCKADSIGVFQVESRAQMTMLPRLKPRNYYDLVIEVAIVRPGPIQGGMVHPYLRRRTGTEPVTYPNDRIKAVLERTLGVPLFQEQAMRMTMVAAGFTAGEADELRRAMAAWKRKGHIMEKFAKKIVVGMLANGYTHAYALQLVEQIKGFGDYGFPESHAASFAHLVYVSAWLKRHHPAEFAAALINSQPMGFYQPAQIVRDAQEHGVETRPVDVNHSTWDCTLEPSSAAPDKPALRLGMRLVSGMRESEADKISRAVRAQGPFNSITALWRASGVRTASCRTLATADACTSMGLDRQQALWAVSRLNDDVLPMFDPLDADEPAAPLPPVAPAMQVIHDYSALGLSLKAHPLSFVREQLDSRGITPAGELANEKRWPHGHTIAVAGLALVRQRPGTASGILFMTIEDETGVANLVIRPPIYERFRRAIRHSTAVIAHGKIERAGQVVHVLVTCAADMAETIRVAPPKIAARNFH